MDNIVKLEELGDDCVSKDNHGEAVIHYTHAIKLKPREYRLVEKRCTSFLQVGQFYFAYQDAKDLILMAPNNPSGFIKRATIEFETGNYRLALSNYRKAYHLTRDSSLSELIHNCKDKAMKQESSDRHLPWVGAALGLVIGMALVVADYMIWMNKGFLKNPMIKVALIISNSYLFYSTLKWYRGYIGSCRRSLLQPPPLLFPEDGDDDLFKSKDD
ncbi:uncharacterized protein LOC128396183 [Panonychus citri]|uniref:uncharacterized protein LOC128396183 n=1 Tax=Panonychus citri TaxID=50023 RepID=UPI002307CFCA|nr:uncharacterized protein LOC128396183 [Panonychus citri]